MSDFPLGGNPEGVLAYELRVVEQPDEEGDRLDREPVIRVEVPGNASGWTPSSERCLEPGRTYSWYVRGHGEAASTKWSHGGWFEVSAEPSLDEVVDALDVLRRYLEHATEDGPGGRKARNSAAKRPGVVADAEDLQGAAAVAADALLQVEGLASFASLDVTVDATIGDDVTVTDLVSAGRVTATNNLTTTNGDILATGSDRKIGFSENWFKELGPGTNGSKLRLNGIFFPDNLGWLELHQLSFHNLTYEDDTVTKSGGGTGRFVINSLTTFDVDNNTHICSGGGVVVGFRFKEQPTDQLAFDLICTK
jgi:hypothetical protein